MNTAIKSAFCIMISTALLLAGSVSAISNMFSLGTPLHIINKSKWQKEPLFFNHTIELHHTHGGILFKFHGTKYIQSISVIDMRGLIVKKINLINSNSYFWDGHNYLGVKIADGVYVAQINSRYTQSFVFSTKAYH